MTKLFSRRQFILGSASLSGALLSRAALPSSLFRAETALSDEKTALSDKAKTLSVDTKVAMLSAASDRNGQHYGVLLNAKGEIIQREKLPGRCHAAVYNKPLAHAVFFSRRPGNTLHVVSSHSSENYHVNAGEGFHFYGHGVLSHDGRYLFSTENDYEKGEGCISIRSAENAYALVKRIPSFGIGPHELALLNDGKTLVVANGGLKTHPNKRRLPQNLETMQPNVSFIDWESGALIQQHFPVENKMSLRHLCVREDDSVCIGAQYQGQTIDQIPLVMTVSKEQALIPPKHPSNFAVNHKFYTASVCDAGQYNSQTLTVVSCPKANRLTLWSDDVFLAELKIKDVAGVCRVGKRIIYSNGKGQLGELNISIDKLGSGMPNSLVVNEPGYMMTSHLLASYKELRWDNHLISV